MYELCPLPFLPCSSPKDAQILLHEQVALHWRVLLGVIMPQAWDKEEILTMPSPPDPPNRPAGPMGPTGLEKKNGYA